MAKCLVCGEEIERGLVFCNCGCPLNDKDKISRILAIKEKIEENNTLRKKFSSVEEARSDRELRTVFGLQLKKDKKYNFDDYNRIYINYNDFKKKERTIKKYNMLAYKKLVFDYYPTIKDGKFPGCLVDVDKNDGVYRYELVLPTDNMFARVHGDVVLYYEVYVNDKLIVFNTFEPGDILTEGHQKELTAYKGVMVSKAHAEKDMFKINLLNMMEK